MIILNRALVALVPERLELFGIGRLLLFPKVFESGCVLVKQSGSALDCLGLCLYLRYNLSGLLGAFLHRFGTCLEGFCALIQGFCSGVESSDFFISELLHLPQHEVTSLKWDKDFRGRKRANSLRAMPSHVHATFNGRIVRECQQLESGDTDIESDA